jgi:hypothetical protein
MVFQSCSGHAVIDRLCWFEEHGLHLLHEQVGLPSPLLAFVCLFPPHLSLYVSVTV